MTVLAPALVVASTVATAQIAEAQVTPLEDDPDDAPGLGRITGSPEPGPKPEDAGDRGGWAQLTLAVVMLGAVAFIGFQITRQMRRPHRQNVSNTDEL